MRRGLGELSSSDWTPSGGTSGHSLGALGLGPKAAQRRESGRGHASSGHGFGASDRLLTREHG
jgi:hypothetical protein